MSETNTTTNPKQLDELEMFKMSAQHLVQLVEYYRGASDPRLALAVERAIKAHVAVAESLGQKPETSSTVEANAATIKLQPSETVSEETWVDSPWAYLDIPTRSKSRLGPMPRFVPLPTKADPEGSEE